MFPLQNLQSLAATRSPLVLLTGPGRASPDPQPRQEVNHVMSLTGEGRGAITRQGAAPPLVTEGSHLIVHAAGRSRQQRQQAEATWSAFSLARCMA